MTKLGFGTMFVLLLLLAAAGPFIVIWALNTLFPVLAIPYDVWSWLAVIVIHSFFKIRLEYKRS